VDFSWAYGAVEENVFLGGGDLFSLPREPGFSDLLLELSFRWAPWWRLSLSPLVFRLLRTALELGNKLGIAASEHDSYGSEIVSCMIVDVYFEIDSHRMIFGVRRYSEQMSSKDRLPSGRSSEGEEELHSSQL